MGKPVTPNSLPSLVWMVASTYRDGREGRKEGAHEVGEMIERWKKGRRGERDEEGRIYR